MKSKWIAPPATPEPIVTRLTPAEFNDLIRQDYKKYRKVVNDVGVKIQ